MNLKLKNAISDYLNNGVEIDLVITQDSLDKYLDFYNFTIDDSFKRVDAHKVIISIKDLANNDIYHYFDLEIIDNENVIIFNANKYLKPIDKDVKYNFLEKWEYSHTLERVVIAHQNCDDGAGVAEVVNFHNTSILLSTNNINTDIEFMYVDYGTYSINDILEKVKGKLVYISDFSFPTDEFKKILEVSENAVIVDHHESPFYTLVSDMENTHFDMTKSGAMLTWEFFFGKESIPPYAITLLEDRDLWKYFEGTRSKAFKLLLKKEGYSALSEYMSFDEEVSYTKLIDDLEPYIREIESLENSYIERAKKAMKYNFNGTEIYGLNLTSSVSDVLNHVSRLFNTPSFAWWIDEKDNFQISLRNYKDDINVGNLAKVFGGGGHLQASGSRIQPIKVNLEEFFINKKLVITYKIEDPFTKSYFEDLGFTTDNGVNTAYCEAIETIKNKKFHDIFDVYRNDNQDICIRVKIHLR